jgi:alpha-galactosidase
MIRTIFLFLLASFAFTVNAADNPKLKNEIFIIEYDQKLYSKITSRLPDSQNLMEDFFPSEQLILANDTISDFELIDYEEINSKDEIGLKLVGVYSNNGIKIKKELNVKWEKDFPEFLITSIVYTNLGDDSLVVEGWINNYYKILPAKDVNPPFWSFQGASYPDRRDWVQPITEGFKQENYMGMNASDYGGGTPVTDLWRPDVGFAVGHLELTPKLVSIPVFFENENSAKIFVQYKYPEQKILHAGESIETYETFASLHKGDYYNTLSAFSKIMEMKGLTFQQFHATAYEAEWCAWGYERNFTVDEVLGTLPKVSEMGYEWATLDDGWQTAEGDWYLNPERFPEKDKDMITFVDEIHKYNLKAMIWWAPLAVDPGTDLIKNHEDYLLLNKDGSKQDITWWDSYYLCPAYGPVIEYHKDLVKKIMSEWGYEGLKIDGQHLNAAPPCYNKAHNHAYPEESVEKIPEFYKAIIETALNINPEAVVQICPCGTSYSFYNLPYMNQTVSSDPTSSWQIRMKGKTLKALMGSSSPYFGDHVELSDNGSDFASTVGAGGIVGTKFTHPTDRHDHQNYLLTEEKEAIWKKWLDIYKENLLSKAVYRGELYDIGYDRPETHAIQKGDTLYFAFYADEWNGEMELRGLEKKKYNVIDYVNNKKLDTINGDLPKVKFSFNKHLLIKAVPIN